MDLLKARSAALFAAAGLCLSAADLDAGRRGYRLLCVQCHGEDGDATSYANIVPVAGIARRYPPAVIASLSGSFSGRILHGRDRIDVVAYMATLTGAKGFPDPGWVSSPYLVEKKSQRLSEYRVLDTRPLAAYAAAHIPNAIHAPEPCSTAPVTPGWLARHGISPSTVAVVYDEEGGPSAACLWWRIRQAGHPWVSVMDGGWNLWSAERRFTSLSIPRIAPASYPDSSSPPPIRLPARAAWRWRDAVAKTGFLSHSELSALLARPGAPTTADPAEIAHLALVRSLLGLDPEPAATGRRGERIQ